MIGPGVYFATTPEHTVGKAQHGQPEAMMLECYVFTGIMEEAADPSDFARASGSDAVYFRGFRGRPEFVVKDSRRICVVCAYQCDPRTGARIGGLDEANRRSRLQYAQTAWREAQLRCEDRVELRGRRLESAMDRIERRGRTKRRDRRRINRIFNEFSGGERTINRAQLYSLLCAVGMPPADSKGALQEIFDEMDRNGNGRVGKREFRRGIVRRAKRGEFDFDSSGSSSDDS